MNALTLEKSINPFYEEIYLHCEKMNIVSIPYLQRKYKLSYKEAEIVFKKLDKGNGIGER